MKLKRTEQCAKCPWLKTTNPHQIPNGYSETKHRNLKSTIAKEGDFSAILNREPLHIMACHEDHGSHCVGWLVNQMGPGNNIQLRIAMRNCKNFREVKLLGEQHQTFEETLP